MVMGDVVLTEDQVNTAMSAALDNRLEVTALHNHFFWDSPKVMFMHIGGMGDEAQLAGAVDRRRRLRDARVRATTRPQGTPRREHRRRRHPPAHDRRAAARHVPPL